VDMSLLGLTQGKEKLAGWAGWDAQQCFIPKPDRS
jgi:hypothetical protein